MKLNIIPGSTSVLIEIFLSDSSKTDGSGLTGVEFGDITGYFYRSGAASPVELAALKTMTIGTWVTEGFKEIDAVNFAGYYQFGIPNAALVLGSGKVNFLLKGAANMAPLPIEIQIDIDIMIVKGLLGVNSVLDDFSYDANKKATVGNVYVYDTVANASAHDGVTLTGLVFKLEGVAVVGADGNTTKLTRTVG